MNKLVAGIGFAVAAALAPAAIAQTATVAKGSAPGVGAIAQTVKITATVTAVDQAKRTFTLKGPQGREMSFDAGPEVKNFAQLKVGDTVDAEYVEALTMELKKGGKAVVARTESSGKIAAKPGDKPAGAVGRVVTITADVVAVDAATQMVTLKGPNRTVDLKVANPETFKMVKVGDQVEANYTEALAVKVSPSAAKPSAAKPADAKPAPKKP